MHRDIEPASGAGGWTMMPRPNRRLTQLAERTARAARPLLPKDAGLFMALETDASERLRLVWWRSEDFTLVAEISAEPAGFCPTDTAEGALQEAASELLDYLAGRWPAPPAGFGVITDGVGVAFAPTDPAPSAPGWLSRQAAASVPLVAIIGLDANGPCTLLGGSRAKLFH
jgi:hypothetical protein